MSGSKLISLKVTIIMVVQQQTSANLIRALYNLSRERDVHKRQTLLNAGLIEMIKGFSLAARRIIEG